MMNQQNLKRLQLMSLAIYKSCSHNQMYIMIKHFQSQNPQVVDFSKNSQCLRIYI